jgi:hypothetical protein
MSELVTFKHWAPSGDLLACLPGIRQICADLGKRAVIYQRLNMEIPSWHGAVPAVFSDEGKPVCMSESQWAMLKPLLERQPFIDHVEEWRGQDVDVDLGVIKEGTFTPMPNGDLYFWQQLVIYQMATDFSKSWLEVSKEGFNHMEAIVDGRIILNFTERYRNPFITYFWLKEYEDKLIFAGTEKEHEIFKKANDLEIPRLIVNNFLELGQAVDSCKFFMGNQSMCYHIAEGLGKRRMLEVSTELPNVWPHTPLGLPYFQKEVVKIIFKQCFDATT